MPPPAVPQDPSPPPPGVLRGPVLVVAVLAILVLALGGVIVARHLSAPTDVTLEPVATPGANPFMQSVGTDVPDVRPVAAAGGRYSGTTPGLYGGSGDDAVCDRSRLSGFLAQHPDRAAGWASVLGLQDASTSSISRYVDGLTAVVLRSDTYVTNHGWAGGHVTSRPAVLQAGTAVLVDRHGNPVTRCFCGNPLTAPQSFGAVAYVGPRWYSFSATSVTVVTHQTTQVTNDFTVVDVHTGRGHDRPRGTAGEQDTRNDNVIADPQTGTSSSQEAQDGGSGSTEHSVGTGSAGASSAGASSTETTSTETTSTGTTSTETTSTETTSTGADGARSGAVTTDDTTTGTAPPAATPPAVGADELLRDGSATLPETVPADEGTGGTDLVPDTTTPTSASPATEPSGPYTASSACTIGTGVLSFSSGGTYTVDGAPAGEWGMQGDDLVVTPTSDPPATFAASASSWSDNSGCTLTSSP